MADYREELGLDEKFLQEVKKKKEKRKKKNKGSQGADDRPVQRKRPPPEVVVFERPQKKKKESEKADSDNEFSFDMKRSRHEVKRMGIGGLEGGEKKDAMIKLLLDLGAKPPKNQCLNYNILQRHIANVRKKEEKKKEREKAEGNFTKKSKRNDKQRTNRKRDPNDVGFVDGQLGKFKRGFQLLSRNDLARIKQTSAVREKRKK